MMMSGLALHAEWSDEDSYCVSDCPHCVGPDDQDDQDNPDDQEDFDLLRFSGAAAPEILRIMFVFFYVCAHARVCVLCVCAGCCMPL